MTGKSGANAWHGSLLGQNRPSKTRSLSYFARKACELGNGSCEKPSTYFKRNCWVSCEAGEELAPVFIEHVGDDYLMIATDYPHSDAIDKFPDKTVGAISSNNKISAESRRKILWDNPTKTFGLGA